MSIPRTPKADPHTAVAPSDHQGAGNPTETHTGHQRAGNQMPQLAGQSTLWPVLLHQLTMRVYTTEDLAFSTLNFRYWDPPLVPLLQTSILSLVGILASSTLTIMTPHIHPTAQGELTPIMSFKY